MKGSLRTEELIYKELGDCFLTFSALLSSDSSAKSFYVCVSLYEWVRRRFSLLENVWFSHLVEFSQPRIPTEHKRLHWWYASRFRSPEGTINRGTRSKQRCSNHLKNYSRFSARTDTTLISPKPCLLVYLRSVSSKTNFTFSFERSVIVTRGWLAYGMMDNGL